MQVVTILSLLHILGFICLTSQVYNVEAFYGQERQSVTLLHAQGAANQFEMWLGQSLFILVLI